MEADKSHSKDEIKKSALLPSALLFVVLFLAGCNQIDYEKIIKFANETLANETLINDTPVKPIQGDVQLCKDINYAGGCETFAANAPDLRTNSIGNDMASSIIVPAGQVAALYENINYEGACETFTANNPDLRNEPIGNDCASSITVGSGCPSGRAGKSGGQGCNSGGSTDWRTTHYYVNCGQCTRGSPFARTYPDKSAYSYSLCYNDYLTCVNNGCGRILDNCR